MLNEWSDRLPQGEAVAIWQQEAAREFERRLSNVERALAQEVAAERIAPTDFYDAMRHFLTAREKLFPGLPADPAWKILVTLASEPEQSRHRSVTGIAYGAGVPLTTALRYIAALEMEGIIERVPCPGDRRRTFLQLTAEGRRRLDAIADKWRLRLFWLVAIPGMILAALLWPVGIDVGLGERWG